MKILIHGMSVQTSSALILLPIVAKANSSKWLCCGVALGGYSTCNRNCHPLLFSLCSNNLFSPALSILMNFVMITLSFHDLITCCLCHLVFPLAICETLKLVHSLTTILQFALGNATTPSGGRTDDKSRKNISPGTWLIL